MTAARTTTPPARPIRKTGPPYAPIASGRTSSTPSNVSASIAPLGAVVLGDQHVERRHDEQREQRADRHAADEHEADRVTRDGAGAGDERQREVAGDRGDGRHQDRAQADARRLPDRLELARARSRCSSLANSTMRMPFFEIRPTSVTRPTCE